MGKLGVGVGQNSSCWAGTSLRAFNQGGVCGVLEKSKPKKQAG